MTPELSCERANKSALRSGAQSARRPGSSASAGSAPWRAMVLATEIGDWQRFAKPTQLMAYLGLVPTRHSSGSIGERTSRTMRSRALRSTLAARMCLLPTNLASCRSGLVQRLTGE
ncbi:MAG: transposase [Gemmatimonadaceae bacterium]